MATVRLYVPGDLKAQLLTAGAELNWSAIFQAAARNALAGLAPDAGTCPHTLLTLTCEACETSWSVTAPDMATT